MQDLKTFAGAWLPIEGARLRLNTGPRYVGRPTKCNTLTGRLNRRPGNMWGVLTRVRAQPTARHQPGYGTRGYR